MNSKFWSNNSEISFWNFSKLLRFQKDNFILLMHQVWLVIHRIVQLRIDRWSSMHFFMNLRLHSMLLDLFTLSWRILILLYLNINGLDLLRLALIHFKWLLLLICLNTTYFYLWCLYSLVASQFHRLGRLLIILDGI